MISYVWSDDLPLYAGRGGTESFTIGHVRELMARGIPARIVTVGLGKEDGREYYPDVEFYDVETPEQLSKLDDTLIYISYPFNIPTKRQSYVFFHIPPLSSRNCNSVPCYKDMLHPDTIVITNSRFLRGVWSDELDINPNKIHIVYPFADPAYSLVKRPRRTWKRPRILFAGRLSVDKGIFTFLEALHHEILRNHVSVTVTTAGNETPIGASIERIVAAHPQIKMVKARKTPEEMAELYASHDIVVVPSNHQFWHEAFGMVSVEAQHAGCKVVVSNADGLPETNCGELILFEPGNSYNLAQKIARAEATGPILDEQREESVQHFTRSSSIDALLHVLRRTGVDLTLE